MHIEHEVKLDYKDVLIRPKRSTLSTRSNVDISREFRFRHALVDEHGVPIVAANMDTTGRALSIHFSGPCSGFPAMSKTPRCRTSASTPS